jgi:hypothetical protein
MKKNLIIPRRLTILFSLVALVTTAQLGHAQERDRDGGQSCTLATLKGQYQFASSGFVIDATGTHPVAVAGIDTFDGHGNLTSNSTLIVNGVVIFTNLIVPGGSYTIQEDCTGTLTLGANGVQLNIFVAPNGEAFDYVQTAPSGNVLAGTIRRVSHNGK